jgi:hypothetical protein
MLETNSTYGSHAGVHGSSGSEHPEESHGPGEVGPRPGDVVVSDGGQSRVFTLSVFPGTPQLTCPSRAMALTMARTLVRRQRVDSWLSRGGTAFVVLERHR